MNVNREELDLLNEWEKVRAAYVHAKETLKRDDPKYVAAKARMSEMRTHWRQVGEACGTRTPVAPLNVKAG